MIFVPDEHNAVALAGEFDGLQVHFGDQRTGGVNDLEMALPGVASHGRSYSVRAEDGARAGRHFVQFLHKDRSGVAEFVDDVLVMHNLLAYVHGRTIEIERYLHHIDRPHHARTKAPGFEQENLSFHTVIAGKMLERHESMRLRTFDYTRSLAESAAICVPPHMRAVGRDPRPGGRPKVTRRPAATVGCPESRQSIFRPSLRMNQGIA